MKKGRWLLISFMAASVLFGAYYLWREEFPDPPKEVVQAEEEPIFMEGNTISESKDGKLVWEVTAQTMRGSKNSQEIALQNVRGVFYRPQGGTVVLTAPVGVYVPKEQTLRFTGEVKAVSSDGDTFTAKEMGWLAKEERIYGQGQAQLNRKESQVSGDRIESDRDFQKSKVIGNARYVKQ